MRTTSPFDRAGQFFGTEFNNMERASAMQARTQGVGMDDARYGADYDGAYMTGAVGPQSGAYGQDKGPSYDIESLKSELLETARSEKRPVNGNVSVRPGGGLPTASKG